MAKPENSRNTSTREIGSTDDPSCVLGTECAEGLPARSVVYRLDDSVLTYGEQWMLHRNWRVLGAWWRKLSGSKRLSNERLVHIEDHRDIETTRDELPAGVKSATYRLTEEFTKLGFRDFRYSRYIDSYNKLEITNVYAVHPGGSAVLRILRRRNMRDHTLDLGMEITTVFPDSSILTTTNVLPTERAPDAEKRQVKENGGPGELWASHLKALGNIPFPAKAASNAEAAWVLTNEVESKRVRFHLSRGYYAKPTAEECADEALRLLGRFENSQVVEPNSGKRRWVSCSYFSIPQLGGAVAMAIALCIVSADAEPSRSMPPLTASQKRRLAQKGQDKAPPPLSRSSALDVRAFK